MKSQVGARYLGRQKAERDPVSLERAVCRDQWYKTIRKGSVKRRKRIDRIMADQATRTMDEVIVPC